MEKVYDQHSDAQVLRFGSGTKVGSVLKFNVSIKPGDLLRVAYTVTAELGDGPSSVVIKSHDGKPPCQYLCNSFVRNTSVSFLRIRDRLMIQLGWDRRVATLAARLALGSDTWESIASTPSFLGKPLLSQAEVTHIKTIGFGLIREGCDAS
jgi:hypothetical protein